MSAEVQRGDIGYRLKRNIARTRKPYSKRSLQKIIPESPDVKSSRNDRDLDWLQNTRAVPDTEIVDPYVCPVCLSYRVFNERDDSMVCQVCGDSITAHGLRHVSTRPDPSVYTARQPNTPYKSMFHLHERLAVLQNRVTPFPVAHSALIRDTAKQIYGDKSLGRNEVREVLWQIDNLPKDRIETYLRADPIREQQYIHFNLRRKLIGVNYVVDHPPGFSFLKRYLEKWPVIARSLDSPAYIPKRLFMSDGLDHLFQGVEQAWQRVKPETRLNKPNFSYMLLKLFEFTGLGEMYEWLHQLTTWEHKRRNEIWWESICLCHGWSFVTIFPVPQSERLCFFDLEQVRQPFLSLRQSLEQRARFQRPSLTEGSSTSQ